MTRDASHSGGRRPKNAKPRSRGKFGSSWAASAMGFDFCARWWARSWHRATWMGVEGAMGSSRWSRAAYQRASGSLIGVVPREIAASVEQRPRSQSCGRRSAGMGSAAPRRVRCDIRLNRGLQESPEACLRGWRRFPCTRCTAAQRGSAPWREVPMTPCTAHHEPLLAFTRPEATAAWRRADAGLSGHWPKRNWDFNLAMVVSSRVFRRPNVAFPGSQCGRSDAHAGQMPRKSLESCSNSTKATACRL